MVLLYGKSGRPLEGCLLSKSPRMGELAPDHDSHVVVVGIVHPFIRLDVIWAVQSHVG